MAVESVVAILREIADATSLSGDNPQLLLTKMRRYLFSDPSANPHSVVGRMRSLADLHCNGVISTLEKSHPKLQEEDLTLCSLICLRFSPISIQKIYSQSNPGSYYNRRSRLRRRIGLSEGGATLETYLVNMVSEHSARPGEAKWGRVGILDKFLYL